MNRFRLSFFSVIMLAGGTLYSTQHSGAYSLVSEQVDTDHGAKETGMVAGPDAIVGNLFGLAQFGSSGPQVGLALGTEVCNAGSIDIDWFVLPNNDHPVVPQNLYRMSGGASNDDRFEQIGQSSVLHAFFALAQNACGFGCNGINGNHLGSGCSNIDSPSYNAGPNLGSRAWINPFTGVFPGSSPNPNDHVGHTHNGVAHRLLVEMGDLNTTLNQGATYYAEAQYITPHEGSWCQSHAGECNMYNNVSYRRFDVIGTSSFNFSPVGSTVQMPAIYAWPGAARVQIEPDPGNDGIGIVGCKVTNPSPGVWHYEYAIYNENLDRAIQALSIPVGANVTLSNIGFHAPPQHPGWSADGTAGNAGFSSAPWMQTQGGGQITWSSETFVQNQNANAIRWATMYNFRFDADKPPENVNATVGFFKTGSSASVSVQGPSVGSTPTNTPTVTPTSTPTPAVIINEVDSDHTSCSETLQFVELFDGGVGNTLLEGLVVVFYDGATDTSYAAFDLDGYQTNAMGYFTLGNRAVSGVDLIFANGLLQNGADAVALYNANASKFPNGTPVTTINLIDALVYDTGQPDDPGLLGLLSAGQPQVNENANSNGYAVSMQRCPNGSGGPRNTNTYAASFIPTSDTTNTCGATPTITPTPAGTPNVRGTVKYGNAAGPIKYISNATVTGAGSPMVITTTDAPGGTAGQYTLTGFGNNPYTVSVSKTTGQNGISSNDAARIAQHVAGTLALTTNNEKVSADVSGNNVISSNDAALIARFVASVGPPIGNTNTWRFFLPPGPTFPVGSSPTSRTYASLQGNLTCEDYTGLLMGEVTGNWTPSNARPVETSGPERAIAVKLPQMKTGVGKKITVPATVNGVANKNVISYEFDLRYDPSVIQPVGDPVDVKETVSRGLSVVTNSTEPGLLRVVVYGAIPIDQNGVLLNLTFTAVGAPASVSTLTFERIMFNEGEPQVVTTEGKIELF